MASSSCQVRHEKFARRKTAAWGGPEITQEPEKKKLWKRRCQHKCLETEASIEWRGTSQAPDK